MSYTPETEAWAPPGSTADPMPARAVASGDFVLVHKSSGFWALSHAAPEFTQRHSVWAEVVRRERRIFTVRIDGVSVEVGVRNLDTRVIRRARV